MNPQKTTPHAYRRPANPIARAARPPTGATRAFAAPVEDEEALVAEPVAEPVVKAPVLLPEVVDAGLVVELVARVEVGVPERATDWEDWAAAALHQEICSFWAATLFGSFGQLL